MVAAAAAAAAAVVGDESSLATNRRTHRIIASSLGVNDSSLHVNTLYAMQCLETAH